MRTPATPAAIEAPITRIICGPEAKSLPILIEQLQPVTTTPPRRKDLTSGRLLSQDILGQRRQHPDPHIHDTTGLISKAKFRLEHAINKAHEAIGLAEPMEHWALHDLPRSQATALAVAGFSEAVVDRIQNHVGVESRPSAVAAVYSLAKLLTERARFGLLGRCCDTNTIERNLFMSSAVV